MIPKQSQQNDFLFYSKRVWFEGKTHVSSTVEKKTQKLTLKTSNGDVHLDLPAKATVAWISKALKEGNVDLQDKQTALSILKYNNPRLHVLLGRSTKSITILARLTQNQDKRIQAAATTKLSTLIKKSLLHHRVFESIVNGNHDIPQSILQTWAKSGTRALKSFVVSYQGTPSSALIILSKDGDKEIKRIANKMIEQRKGIAKITTRYEKKRKVLRDKIKKTQEDSKRRKALVKEIREASDSMDKRLVLEAKFKKEWRAKNPEDEWKSPTNTTTEKLKDRIKTENGEILSNSFKINDIKQAIEDTESSEGVAIKYYKTTGNEPRDF